jgi:hypothetical protein
MCPDNLRMRATRVFRDEFREVIVGGYSPRNYFSRRESDSVYWLASICYSFLVRGRRETSASPRLAGEDAFSQTKLGVDFFLAQVIAFDVEETCTPA